MKFAWDFILPFFDRVRRNPYYLTVESAGAIVLVLWALEILGWKWIPASMILVGVIYSWIEYAQNRRLVDTPEYKFGKLEPELNKMSVYFAALPHSDSEDKKQNNKKVRDFIALREQLQGLDIPCPPTKLTCITHAAIWRTFLTILWGCSKERNLAIARKVLEEFKTGVFEPKCAKTIGLYKPDDGEQD